MGRLLGGRRVALEPGNGGRQLAAARVGAGGSTARRVAAAAQHDPARVGKVALGSDRRPSGRQAAPAVEQRTQVAGNGGAHECDGGGLHPDPLGQRALAVAPLRARRPVRLGRPVAGRQQAGGAARIADLGRRIVVGPQERALQLAADDGLDRGPRALGCLDLVEQRRPARRRQPTAEPGCRVVRLGEGGQLGASCLESLADLDGVLARRVGRRLCRVALVATRVQRGERRRGVARRLGQVAGGRLRGDAQLGERGSCVGSLARSPARAESAGARLLVRTGPRRDAVALSGTQLGHGLLRGEQGVVGGRELGDGRLPGALGVGCRGQRRVDGLAGGAVGEGREQRRDLLELLLFARQLLGELGLASRDPLEPTLAPDELLARRLSRGRGEARRLLRLPVARLRRRDRRAAGVLGRAVLVQGGIGRGRATASVAERRSRGLLPAPVRRHDQRARPGTEGVVLLLMLGLHRQASDLRLELAHQVADARQVVARSDEAHRRLVAPHLEPLDAGRLLEELAPLLGAKGEGGIDRPLPHHDQLVRAQPTLAEQLDHVTQARPGAVDEVLALARAIGPTPDRHLGEVDRQPAIGVVERQHGLRHALRPALLGPAEDDVVGATRAQGSVRLLAEHPAHRIGHVALARAVRADHGVHAGLEDEPRLVGERLEAVEPQLLQAAHDAVGCVVGSGFGREGCQRFAWPPAPRPVGGSIQHRIRASGRRSSP